MQSSDKPVRVYKMSEEDRAKNRERQQRWQFRKKLATGAVIALEKTIVEAPNDSGMGTAALEAISSPTSPPDAA